MSQQGMILTINGGSSSIKFSLCSSGRAPEKVLTGSIDRIGQGDTKLKARSQDGASEETPLPASDHREAANGLADWVLERAPSGLSAVGHRVVHGGFRLVEHQFVTDEVIAELKEAEPLDLAHLPREIALIEAFRERFGGVPQVACFDTEFHRDLPRVAKLMPIPRRYDEQGVRRLGFHGLSYTYLLSELQRQAGEDAANGRVILAHLGSGASMAAVLKGRSIDTSMGFTPTPGLVMGTRPGDLDPGVLVYLARTESMSADKLDEFISSRCGLLGVSETSSDMSDLLSREGSDERAKEAVELFCYSARKYIGAFAAALGGLDTLVFSGGIGEHAAPIRERICDGLSFLGIRLDPTLNAKCERIVSPDDSPVTVRVIPTDEEIVIARIVGNLLQTDAAAPATTP